MRVEVCEGALAAWPGLVTWVKWREPALEQLAQRE